MESKSHVETSGSEYESKAEQPLSISLLPRHSNDRLSLSPEIRIPLAVVNGFIVGTISGALKGSNIAALRFRAENAHRLPNSQKGWYYYHKTKNYKSSLAAGVEGPKVGMQLGLWIGAFMMLENTVDQARGEENKDFISTVFAALTTSGAFSLWKRLPAPAAARTMNTGLRIGLAYGLLQDTFSLLQGRKLRYIELIRQIGTGSRDDEHSETSSPITTDR